MLGGRQSLMDVSVLLLTDIVLEISLIYVCSGAYTMQTPFFRGRGSGRKGDELNLMIMCSLIFHKSLIL